MKSKRWIIAGSVALALWMPANSALAFLITSTSQVFQVEASLSGVVLTNGFQASKEILTSADIINLARGRAMTDAVPSNEVLGWVVPCGAETPTSLIVFDTVASSNLVTVATNSLQGTVDNEVQSKTLHAQTADSMLATSFGATGNAANGWTSGILAFSIGVKFTGPGSCAVQSISAVSATGALGGLMKGVPVGNLKGIQAGAPFLNCFYLMKRSVLWS